MLNKNQLIAAQHFKGPMMVIAGPGSGKTTVIAHRVYNLITKNSVHQSEILVITFTRSAAQEMSSRFKRISDGKYKDVTFSTFHSLFFRILKTGYGYTSNNILSTEESHELLKQVVNVLALEPEDARNFTKHLQEEMSLAKNEMITLSELRIKCCAKDVFLKIATEFANSKKNLNKIDFDDMQSMCFKALSGNENTLNYWSNKYKYILIDEFQDINKVQYKCMCLLASKYRNIFIVGDDDQSIYKFRGARPDFLLNFSREFPECESIILDINYRSSENILYFAKSSIKNNKKRFQKDIKGIKGIGEGITLINNIDMNDEALTVVQKIKMLVSKFKLKYSDIAVIYRTNMQARPFVEFLNDTNIPYILKDDMPDIYSHWICKDLCAYFEAALMDENAKAIKRIINKPLRYMSKMIIGWLDQSEGDGIDYLLSQGVLEDWQKKNLLEFKYQISAVKKRKPFDAIKYIRKAIGYDSYIREYADFKKVNPSDLYEILDELADSSKKSNTLEDFLDFVKNAVIEKKNNSKKEKIENAVTLSTIHSVKGMEYEAVFICGVVNDLLPYTPKDSTPDIEEERRLFYVAITRAKNLLYISTVQSRHDEKVVPSQFIKEIEAAGKKRML